METIRQKSFGGERALYAVHDLNLQDVVFTEGESPLKESWNLDLDNVLFTWKYPLWYCSNVDVRNSTWYEMGRAGVWYTDHISVRDSLIEAPKNFRRCKDLHIENTSFSRAEETLWNCRNVTLKNLVVNQGDYFGMGCSDLEIEHLTLYGNYAFDGVRNMTIRSSKLLTKDAFWNTENVTVYDSFISGEYLGWNSKKLTLVNCTIESLQGLCYVENLKLVNCRLINTTLAFEYSTNIDATVTTEIDSVTNPASGVIRARGIRSLILEDDKIDPSRTEIILDESSHPKSDDSSAAWTGTPNTQSLQRRKESIL